MKKTFLAALAVVGLIASVSAFNSAAEASAGSPFVCQKYNGGYWCELRPGFGR